MMNLTISSTELLLLERERRARLRQRIPYPTLSRLVETTSGLTLEPWQHIICDRLQALVHQTGQRLLIHGPPQFGKSIIISQRFPVYTLGVNPGYRVRVACYNVSHAERFSGVNLELMRDPAFIEFFPNPGARVPNRASIEEWSTVARSGKRDANPSFKPLGLGTGFTGLGVDTLVIDDPYKDRMEARSEATNAMLWGWWTDTVLPRLNPTTNVVVMFHRWWEGDFAGRLLDQGGWEMLRFPAIADGGADDPTSREIGEILSPRYSREFLEDVRRLEGTSFEALFQGTPYPAEGSMFKTGKVEFIDAMPAAARRIRGWDISDNTGTGDHTAGVLLATVRGKYIVEDVIRGQWASDERDRIIRQTAELDGRAVTHILPQDPGQAGKGQAAAFIRLLAGFTVVTELESGSKEVRADPFSSQWNAGNVQVLRDTEARRWNRAYLAEMESFPQGKFDDQVDGTSKAFNLLAEQGNKRGHGIIAMGATKAGWGGVR